MNKNIEICQLLLKDKRIDPTIRSHEGLTPLFLGIATNAPIEIIKMLVRKKQTLIGICNNEEIAPLHEAVKNKRLDIVKVLIANGAHVNAYDLDLENALHYAASSADHEMIEYLLKETEIDVTAKNRDEMNPLCLLIVRSRNQPEDIVSSCFHLLLEYTFEKDQFSGTYNIEDIFQPAFLAAVYSHKEIVKFIIHNIYSVSNSRYKFISELCDAFVAETLNDEDEEIFYYLLVFLHEKINRYDKFHFPRFAEINYFMSVRSVMHVTLKLLSTHESVDLTIRLMKHLEEIGFNIIRVKEFEDNLGMILCDKFSKLPATDPNHQFQLDCAKHLLEYYSTRQIKMNDVIRSFLHSIAIARLSEGNNLSNMESILRLLFRFQSTFFFDVSCWKQISEFKNLHDNIRQIVLWINETFGTHEVTCKIMNENAIIYKLKHLCRNSIRSCIKNSHAITTFGLPECLQNYLIYVE